MKCAVGVLIPDRRYSYGMETRAAHDSMVALVLEQLGHEPGFCTLLQNIHDNKDVQDWPAELRILAARRSLDSSIVDQMEPAFREKLEKK